LLALRAPILLSVTAGLVIVLLPRNAAAAPPRVTDSRYKLELVAKEPEIVTPIGMAFDSKGRLLVVESHTHERQAGYEGPLRDRIRMLADSNGDGRLDEWSTFAEGFRHATNVLARKDGAVYLAERGRLLLLRDTDGDGKADAQDELLRMETKDDYPHNGFGGIDQTAGGSLIISMGENHGEPFRITSADGKVFEGTGGLDGLFRCDADGKNLEHFARGVWNPFSVCVLDDGRIFAVDNDPDSSPPCRLLHVVEGGDYGYLYQYGRAGTHPLQAWNGELPGALPMVCGTGEAPTAIVPHAGSLWVTSWGDYRIERYRLVPRGASYGATREIIVQGGADFRPTGMAVAPDGSIYFGDWVLRDYAVHRNGRIWRLVLPQESSGGAFPPFSPHEHRDDLVVEAGLRSNDPFEHTAAVRILGSQAEDLSEHPARTSTDASVRLGWLEALRQKNSQLPPPVLKEALEDQDSRVRLFAVRCIADERIIELRDAVANLLEGPQPSAKYYLAALGALDWLDHEPEMRGTQIADELLVKELQNEKRSPEAHALALRIVRPDVKFLTHDRLRGYLKSEHRPLRLEAVRSLQQRTSPKRFAMLAEIAGDESQDEELRAEAVVGLAADAASHRDLLEKLAAGEQPSLQHEARRVLRLSGVIQTLEEAKPQAANLARWNKVLSEPGDAASGRRLFFNPVGPRCAVCHKHDGRGGQIGPDLTHIGRSNNREQIIASTLQPSQNVAPHYQPWSLVTKDGKTHMGLRLPQGGDNGIERYIDSAGAEFSLPSDTIEERSASDKSIMPDGIETTLTLADLRDLVTFLTTDN
jgi:putative membrane-bound dehydrogenase-like protein